MTTVGAAVHIHLEGTTQTRLVCGCVGVCVGGVSEGRSGIVYTCIRYLKQNHAVYWMHNNYRN